MSSNTVGYTESKTFRCLEDLEKAYIIGSGSPIRLCYCGMEDCEPGWRFGPYVRENYVIHVVTGGKGTFRVRDTDYELTKDRMFIIYPDEETVYCADEEDPWSYMWIGFNGREAEKITKAIGFFREEPVVELKSTDKIKEAMESILDAKQLTIAGTLKRNSAFYSVLSSMIEQSLSASASYSDPEDRYVSRAVDIITASYAERIKISEVADILGINRSYLSSIFKRSMQMSPQEFLINFRLEKAARLLRETEDQIGSIAASVGYTDALAFSKAFRQKYGETPSNFRNSAPTLESGDTKGGYTGKLGL